MTTQMAFMKQAIRNRIKDDVIPNITVTGSDKSATCELTDNGQPIVPYAGLIFFAVHGGRRRNNAGTTSYYRDETYFFNITVSLRSAHKLRLRTGDKVISGGECVEYLTDLVINSLDGYLALADDTNTLLLAEYPDNDHQPILDGERPVFLEAEEPKDRTSSWWDAKISDQGQIAGMSQTSRFQGLRLIREIGQA